MSERGKILTVEQAAEALNRALIRERIWKALYRSADQQRGTLVDRLWEILDSLEDPVEDEG